MIQLARACLLIPALRTRIYGEGLNEPQTLASAQSRPAASKPGRCIRDICDELRGCLGCARDGLNRPAPVATDAWPFRKKLPLGCIFRPRADRAAPARGPPRATPRRRRSRRRRSRTARRARRARLRADRHRQDRRVRAADPAAPRRRPPAARPEACRALVLTPDARARRADRRELRRLRPPPGAPSRRRLRRRRPGPAGQALARGVDILVATPGRLLDLMGQGHVRLDARRGPRARRGRPHARHGLHPRRPPDHSRRCPGSRQTLLFSATMPPEIAPAGRQHS